MLLLTSCPAHSRTRAWRVGSLRCFQGAVRTGQAVITIPASRLDATRRRHREGRPAPLRMNRRVCALKARGTGGTSACSVTPRARVLQVGTQWQLPDAGGPARSRTADAPAVAALDRQVACSHGEALHPGRRARVAPRASEDSESRRAARLPTEGSGVVHCHDRHWYLGRPATRIAGAWALSEVHKNVQPYETYELEIRIHNNLPQRRTHRLCHF